MGIKDAIERDGYVVIRDLLTESEISDLSSALIKHFSQKWEVVGLGKHQPNAAMEIPAIGWLFSHPKIVASFRQLFGCEDVFFTTNCDAHMNMLSWWHKDGNDSENGCFSRDCFANEDCKVYRAGVYLQDHDRDSNGLKVRKGSHRIRTMSGGDIEVLNTRAGDVIFFDIRLTHAGQFADPFEWILYRVSRKLRCEAAGKRLRSQYQHLLRKPRKLSIFFTFGMTNAASAEFCRFEAEAKSKRASLIAMRPAGNGRTFFGGKAH